MGPITTWPTKCMWASIIPWYLHTSMTLWILMGQVGLTICIWWSPNIPNFHSWLHILVMHPSFQSFPNVLDSTKVCMAWMLVKMGPISHNPTIFLPDEYLQTYLSSIWFWIRSLEILKGHIMCKHECFIYIYIYIVLFQISSFNVQKWQIFSENTHFKIFFKSQNWNDLINLLIKNIGKEIDPAWNVAHYDIYTHIHIPTKSALLRACL
jgi:hypothetical protein